MGNGAIQKFDKIYGQWLYVLSLINFSEETKKMPTAKDAILEKLKTLFNGDKWAIALQAITLPGSLFWVTSFANREFSHCEAASALACRGRGNPCIFLMDKTGWTLLILYPSFSNTLKYMDRFPPRANALAVATTALFLSMKPP
jgi:hypothetical protein